jgi:hypothetical protein
MIGVHWSVRVDRPDFLPCLGAVLSLACGRTDLSTHSVADGATNAPDLAAADVNGPRNCGTMSIGSGPPMIVEFVVDASLSMQEIVPESGQTRWEMTRNALKKVFSELGLGSTPSIGLTLFPNRGDCAVAPIAVPAAPFSEQLRSQLLAALDGVTAPAGTRPTAAALALALADSQPKLLPNGFTLSGAYAVVLLTAGGPDASLACGDQEDPISALENQVRTARAEGVPTCVYSLPGTGAARDLLVDTAKIGVPGSDYPNSEPPGYCFWDSDQGANSGEELAAGLRCLLAAYFPQENKCIDFGMSRDFPRTCFLPLGINFQGADPANATAEVTVGVEMPRNMPRADCSLAGANGWDLAPDMQSMTFCGQSCDDYLASLNFTLTFGCKGD